MRVVGLVMERGDCSSGAMTDRTEPKPQTEPRGQHEARSRFSALSGCRLPTTRGGSAVTADYRHRIAVVGPIPHGDR